MCLKENVWICFTQTVGIPEKLGKSSQQEEEEQQKASFFEIFPNWH